MIPNWDRRDADSGNNSECILTLHWHILWSVTHSPSSIWDFSIDIIVLIGLAAGNLTVISKQHHVTITHSRSRNSTGVKNGYNGSLRWAWVSVEELEGLATSPSAWGSSLRLFRNNVTKLKFKWRLEQIGLSVLRNIPSNVTPPFFLKDNQPHIFCPFNASATKYVARICSWLEFVFVVQRAYTEPADWAPCQIELGTWKRTVSTGCSNRFAIVRDETSDAPVGWLRLSKVG